MTASSVPLPLTRGRVTALLIGVPVCLALVLYNGFDLVANFGQGRYPVSYTFPANDRSLDVSVAGGQLAIRPTTASRATLAGTARYSLVRSSLTEHTAGGVTRVGYHCPIPVGECEIDGTVNVPGATPVTAHTDGGDAVVTGTTGPVTLSSGGGDISADHATGPLTLDTSGGSIRATTVTAPTLTATTGGGNITADNVRSSTITARTSGGSIDATGVVAPAVTASTGGGNIDIRFTSVPRAVDVNTSGGSITLVLPRGPVTYHVTATTAGGEVNDSVSHSDAPSSYQIIATSGGGNITIGYAS
jgi:Toastrack DUF4097